MGLDLELMAVRHEREFVAGETVYSYDNLNFDRDYTVFGQIADPNGEPIVSEQGVPIVVRTLPLPRGLKLRTFDGERARTTNKNPYGNEMVYALAKDMRKIKLPRNASQRNRAIMAYIRNLPEETPVVLRLC